MKCTGKGKPMSDSLCHKGPMPGMKIPDSAACMKHMPMRESAITEGFKYSNGKTECCPVEKGKISFVAGMSNPQTLTCEIAIPLREIYGDGYDLAKVASVKIRLEIAVEAIEKPSFHGMMKKGSMPGAGHPGEGAHDSLKRHRGEGMHGGPAGMLKKRPEGKPGVRSEGKPKGRPEGMAGEGMHGAPPEGMEQPFAMPDTTFLLQKQSIQCKVILATGK
jgi:hypothetical protein